MKRTARFWKTMMGAMLAVGPLGVALAQPCDDATLVSSPFPSPFGYFGSSCATSGTTLMVGEPGARNPGTAPKGAVHFYERSFPNTMVKTYGFIAIDQPDNSRLGSSVSISGDYAVAGLPGYSVPGYPNLGIVAVFHRVNGAWGIETYVFSPINAPDQSFGIDVSLHGNALVVGASGHNSLQGIAYFFERVGTSWILRSTLNPTHRRTPAELFGASVAVGDRWIVVGAPYSNSVYGPPAAGKLHFFRRNGSVVQWDGALEGIFENDMLGSDLAMTPTQILAGWPGRRSVVSWDITGSECIQQLQIRAPVDTATRNYQQMGMTFALSPDEKHVVMNSPSSMPRMALQYRIDSGIAVLEGEHLPSQNDGGNLGPGLALFNDQVVLGSQFSSVSGQVLGGAVHLRPYLPGLNESPCTPTAITEPGMWRYCTAGGPVVPEAQGCNASQDAPSQWFLIDPPCPGRFLVNTVEATFPTVLSSYSGSCDDRVLMDCNSENPGWGNDAVVQVDTTNGPVLVRVAGARGSSGMYTMMVTSLAPVNDTCFGAQALEPGTYPVCNQFATQDYLTDVYCSPRLMPSNDLWYTFTPTCSGTATIAAHNNTFDTVLAAYTGGCFAGYQLLACNDDSFPYGTGSMLQFPATAGVTYTLRLGGYYADVRGKADLTVDFARGCAADFNFDGGVDGADVSEFFAKWEAGEPCADVNEDGGVDGADVSWFFGVWEAGGC
jgi:hypothetical protein